MRDSCIIIDKNQWYEAGIRYPICETLESWVEEADSVRNYFKMALLIPYENQYNLITDAENVKIQELIDDLPANTSSRDNYNKNGTVKPDYKGYYDSEANAIVIEFDSDKLANSSLIVSSIEGRLIESRKSSFSSGYVKEIIALPASELKTNTFLIKIECDGQIFSFSILK